LTTDSSVILYPMVSPPAAEMDTACTSRHQRGLRALGNHIPLLLGHSRHDVEGEAGSSRHVDGNEVDAIVHQLRDEGDITRQSVQLCDHQDRTSHPTLPEGLIERWAVCPCAALNLLKLHEQGAVADIGSDRRSLSLKTESGLSLALRGTTVIRNIAVTDGVAPVSSVVEPYVTPTRSIDLG
jgi:hypothetical protein